MKRRVCTLILTVSLLVGMLATGFVLPASAADEVEVFSANFALNKNGSGVNYINNNTNNVQDYLLSKFAFYHNQEGTYFERPHVNGYVADAEGNSITGQGATVGVATYAPDTGIKMDGTQYIDYTGNKSGPLAQWAAEWNYLFCNDRLNVDAYRNSNWMFVKNENGDLASLKNFRAEVEFLPYNVDNKASTVAVVFRAKTAGNVLGSDGAVGERQLVSFDLNGGMYFGNSFVRNTTTHSESIGQALEKEVTYILTVEVVGDTATILLVKKDGTQVYKTTKTLTELDSGYLGFGGTLRGVGYKTIKVTRLDKDGNEIDYGDTTDGHDFFANFHGLGTYRDECHWLMGTESAVKGYYRDNGDANFAWYEKVNTDPYTWKLYEMDNQNANDASILSYLNSKFSINFEGQGWSRSSGKSVETKFSGHSQSGEAYFSLQGGKGLNAVYTVQGTDGQNNIQKALSLQPKKADGSLWQLKNFETSFTVGLNTSQATSAVAFYFRATHNGSVASNATANVLVLNSKGYQFFEGTGPSNKYAYDAYTPWDVNGVTCTNYRVYLKVLDDKLVFTVSSVDGQIILADVEKTIADGDAGYLHYTFINGNNILKDVAFDEVTAPVQADNTAVVDGNTITVKAGEGYELKAGSLVVTDANNNVFVPTRVGYREGGDATRYTIPAGAVAPFEVDCEFIQPGDEAGYNVGFLGTSTNAEKGGLRFVNRFNIDEEGNMLYNGEKVAVKEYGMLIASAAILPNAADLDIETAADSMHVHQIKWGCEGGSAKFYDKCADYADVSVQIVGIPEGAARALNFHTRAYIVLADDTVVYMDTMTANYNNG